MDKGDLYELIERIAQHYPAEAKSAANRAAQAVDFFFAGSTGGEAALEQLLVCLEKEIEFLKYEADYVEQHMPYYHEMVTISRRQEADLLSDILQEISASAVAA